MLRFHLIACVSKEVFSCNMSYLNRKKNANNAFSIICKISLRDGGFILKVAMETTELLHLHAAGESVMRTVKLQ